MALLATCLMFYGGFQGLFRGEMLVPGRFPRTPSISFAGAKARVFGFFVMLVCGFILWCIAMEFSVWLSAFLRRFFA